MATWGDLAWDPKLGAKKNYDSKGNAIDEAEVQISGGKTELGSRPDHWRNPSDGYKQMEQTIRPAGESYPDHWGKLLLLVLLFVVAVGGITALLVLHPWTKSK